MAEPRSLAFGVNLNNREPLIAPDYGMAELLDLSEVVEGLGFDSVWVGDSLFSKPRYEPISLLSAISQRTKGVKLGTACLVSSSRNPLYLALELEGVSIHVLHDVKEIDLLRRHCPLIDPRGAGFDVVVSGHSHKPTITERDGVQFVNPGSAGPRRFRLPVTIAYLDVTTGAIRARIRQIL